MNTKRLIKVSGVQKVFAGFFAKRNARKILTEKPNTDRQTLFEETGALLALNNFKFDVKEHEILVIMGESGSGKSTLLRLIPRLIEPDLGSINIDGIDILSLNKKQLRKFRQDYFSMIFQHYGLMPHWTVIENIRYALNVKNFNKKSQEEIALHWIEQVGLAGFENHFPSQLSGGMRQRVGTARAFACNPRVMFLDEPFSAVDPLVRIQLQDQLLGLYKSMKSTIIMVTHDIDEALHLGDRIIICKDGLIQQIGTPEQIVYESKNSYVEDFVQNINKIRVITCEHSLFMPKTILTLTKKVQDALAIFHKEADLRYILIHNTGKAAQISGIIMRDTAELIPESMHQDPLEKHMITVEKISTAKKSQMMGDLLNPLKSSEVPVIITDEHGKHEGIIDRQAFIDAL